MLFADIARCQIGGTGMPPGIELVSTDSLDEWIVDVQVLDQNPLYMDQTFRLHFRFPSTYPIGERDFSVAVLERQLSSGSLSSQKPPRSLTATEPPEVVFRQQADRPIPMHPHVYSNGIICLDLLGTQGWSPVQNVESVCMSLQSMLTGNTKNERPPGDEEFVRTNRQRPRDIEFWYHDNQV